MQKFGAQTNIQTSAQPDGAQLGGVQLGGAQSACEHEYKSDIEQVSMHETSMQPSNAQTSKLDDLQVTLGFNNFMDCAKLRVKVFIYEQGFSKDLDEIDLLPITQHICAYTSDGDCVGCLRYFPVDDNREPATDKNSSTWSIGRLTIAKQMRGRGLGSAMLSIGEAEAALAGAKHIELHAQCNKQPFYELHGYVAHGKKDKDEFMDHIWMGKDL